MAEGVPSTRPEGYPAPPGDIHAPEVPSAIAAPPDAPEPIPYDPGVPLAAHLHRHACLLPPDLADVLRARIPARGPPEPIPAIGNRLRLPHVRVQALFNEAWNRIDAETGVGPALSGPLATLRRRAPVPLREVLAMPWARGLPPEVLAYAMAMFWNLHIVVRHPLEPQVVPFPETTFADAVKRLGDDATAAMADRAPRSLTKGVLRASPVPRDARIALSRLLEMAFEGCDAVGIQVRLGLEEAAVANLFGSAATLSVAEATSRLSAAMPDPPDALAVRAMLSRHAVAAGGDDFSRPPRPPPPLQGAALRAAVEILEEQPYEITTSEIRRLVAERTGHRPSEAAIDAALAGHGRLVRTDPSTWVGRDRRRGPDPDSPLPVPTAPGAHVLPNGLEAAADQAPTGDRAPGDGKAPTAPAVGKARRSSRRTEPIEAVASKAPVPKAAPARKPSAKPAQPRPRSRYVWTDAADKLAIDLWRRGARKEEIAGVVGDGATPGNVMSRLRELGEY